MRLSCVDTVSRCETQAHSYCAGRRFESDHQLKPVLYEERVFILLLIHFVQIRGSIIQKASFFSEGELCMHAGIRQGEGYCYFKAHHMKYHIIPA